jgi:hypothetical protein
VTYLHLSQRRADDQYVVYNQGTGLSHAYNDLWLYCNVDHSCLGNSIESSCLPLAPGSHPPGHAFNASNDSSLTPHYASLYMTPLNPDLRPSRITSRITDPPQATWREQSELPESPFLPGSWNFGGTARVGENDGMPDAPMAGQLMTSGDAGQVVGVGTDIGGLLSTAGWTAPYQVSGRHASLAAQQRQVLPVDTPSSNAACPARSFPPPFACDPTHSLSRPMPAKPWSVAHDAAARIAFNPFGCPVVPLAPLTPFRFSFEAAPRLDGPGSSLSDRRPNPPTSGFGLPSDRGGHDAIT